MHVDITKHNIITTNTHRQHHANNTYNTNNRSGCTNKINHTHIQ